MPKKKEKEKILLFTEENKKGVVSVCDSIISGKKLSVKQLEDTYLFMVEVGCKIERKIKMVLEIVYPSVWKCFYGLDNFNVFCKTLYDTLSEKTRFFKAEMNALFFYLHKVTNCVNI